MTHALAIALFCAAGCRLSPGSSSDAGAPDAPAQSVGDQCEAIFAELCTQAVTRCALPGFTIDQCIASDMPSCCTGSSCNQTALSSAAQVEACKRAIDAEDCNAIVNSSTPGECQGVPRRP